MKLWSTNVTASVLFNQGWYCVLPVTVGVDRRVGGLSERQRLYTKRQSVQRVGVGGGKCTVAKLAAEREDMRWRAKPNKQRQTEGKKGANLCQGLQKDDEAGS